MATLSRRDTEILRQRGITASSDTYGVKIVLTTIGVAWLFNYLYTTSKVGSSLSLGLLKEVAKFEPQDWRDLRIRALSLPVYEEREYFSYILYLNGTPPRAFHSFSPTSSIFSRLTLPLSDSGTFKVRNNQIVEICFSINEVEQLQSGEYVVQTIQKPTL